jgi:cytochrome c oxidase cbb3-type subunit 2
MPYLAKWHLVLARTRSGQLNYHYLGTNPLIPWLSDEQAEHLIRLGAVELVEGDTHDEEAADNERVARIAECADALDRLAVPADSGAPTAREALRAEGLKFGNDTIAAAVKYRRTAARIAG